MLGIKHLSRIDQGGLTMESITEHHLVSELIVYGYLRLPCPNSTRRAALTLALASYCDQHELTLSTVFADQADDKVLTPAFAGLMDALAVDGSYGVVLPSPAHMGGRETAQPRSERIAATGRRLMLLRGVVAKGSNEARTRPGSDYRPGDRRGSRDVHHP